MIPQLVSHLLIAALGSAFLPATPAAQDCLRFPTDLIHTNAFPERVLAADFDGDGVQDLAVLNGLAVTVFLGDGARGFELVFGAAVGSDPSELVSGDWNEDGVLDLAFADAVGMSLELWSGTGAGLFAFLASLPVAGTPWSLEALDLDGDGHADLAATCAGSGLLEIRWGRGDGTFDAGAFATGTDPRAVAFADLRGLGVLDAVVAGGALDDLSILLAAGPRQFDSPLLTPSTVSVVEDVQVEDLDSDGFPDAAVIGSGSDTLAVLAGDGTGSFLPRASFPLEAFVHADWLQLVDLETDGDLDLVCENVLAGAQLPGLQVFENDGLGGFSARPFLPFLDDAARADPLVADVDGDGAQDLLGLAYPGRGFRVAWGDGSGGFPDLVSVVAGGPELGTEFRLVDVDLDRHLDIVAGTSDFFSGVLMSPGYYPGHGDGTFGAWFEFDVEPSGLEGLRLLAVTDALGSCLPDILFVEDAFGTNPIHLQLVPAETVGVFGRAQQASPPLTYRVEQVGDLNADGRLDYVAVVRGSLPDLDYVLLGLGDGLGNFTEVEWRPSPPTLILSVATGDLNADGRDDVVFADFDSGGQALLSQADLSFRLSHQFTWTVTAQNEVALHDLDRDGDLDVLAAGSNSTTDVEIHTNDGAGSFSLRSTWDYSDFGFAGRAEALRVTDLDGDGTCEVIDPKGPASFLSKYTALELDEQAVAVGETAIDLPMAMSRAAIAVGDLDEDGLPDLVVRSSAGRFLVARNLGCPGDLLCQQDLGLDGPGSARLRVCGDALESGGKADLEIYGGPLNRLFVVGAARTFSPTCLLDTLIVPLPLELAFVLAGDAAGKAALKNIPGGFGPLDVFVQAGYLDATLPNGIGVTNAVRLAYLP